MTSEKVAGFGTLIRGLGADVISRPLSLSSTILPTGRLCTLTNHSCKPTYVFSLKPSEAQQHSKRVGWKNLPLYLSFCSVPMRVNENPTERIPGGFCGPPSPHLFVPYLGKSGKLTGFNRSHLRGHRSETLFENGLLYLKSVGSSSLGFRTSLEINPFEILKWVSRCAVKRGTVNVCISLSNLHYIYL